MRNFLLHYGILKGRRTGGCFFAITSTLKRKKGIPLFLFIVIPPVLPEKAYHHCSRGAGNILRSAIPSLLSMWERRNRSNDLGVLLTIMDESSQYSERDVCDQCNRTDDQGDSETFEVDVQFELKSWGKQFRILMRNSGEKASRICRGSWRDNRHPPAVF